MFEKNDEHFIALDLKVSDDLFSRMMGELDYGDIIR
jgi:hypothetical protein